MAERISRFGRNRQIAVGLVVSVIFLALAVRNVRFGEVYEHLSHTRYGFLVASMAAGLVMTWARGMRWGLLFHPASPRRGALVSATIIGYTANNFLPLRAGEVIRGYLAAQTGVSFWAVMATLAVERTFDMLVILLFLGGVVAAVPVPAIVRDGALVLVVIDVVLIVGLFVLAAWPVSLKRMLLGPLRRWPTTGERAERWLGHFIEGVRCLRPGRHVMPLLAWTGAIWAINIVALWLAMLAARLEVPPSATLTILVFSGLGLAVPSGPGYLGTLEFFVTLALGVYGVSTSQALGFAVLLRVANMIPITVAGVLLLAVRNLSLGEVSRAARSLRATLASS